MKFQLLPSTFEKDGSASARQHLSCLIINDRIALDAGSLAMAVSEEQRRSIRDIVLTHAHLDHIAGLPLFIDDLFADLTGPVRIYAIRAVIEILERDIFNWSIYPRYSELMNNGSPVVEYRAIEPGSVFTILDVSFTPIPVDHKVPSTGYLISDGSASVAFTGDTASLATLKAVIAEAGDLKAVLVECAFPDEMAELAGISHHMTPAILAKELEGFGPRCPIFVLNIKPSYRDQVVRQLIDLSIDGLEPMTIGRPYFW